MEEIKDTIQTPEDNYAEILANVKNTTVSREEYNRVMEQNKILANALATQPAKSTDEVEVVIPSDEEIAALRKKLFKKNSGISNREFIKTALDLRDALMAKGERDPFLPTSKDYQMNENDLVTANQLSDGLRDVLEFAGTDDALFNNELKRVCK